MVQWQPPPAGQWNGEIKGYIIRYRLSGYATADSDYPATNHSDYPATNEKNVSNEHARNTLIEPLITWREYDIQVAAYNDRGPGVFSKPIVVTTLEGVPMQSPQNVAVEVLNSTAIRVEFDPPDQQMIPGVNLGYKVELWKDDGQANSHGRTPFRVVRLFPESGRQRAEIGSLERFGHYNLTVVCLTAPGEGPRSPPVEVITREDVPGPISSISFDEIGHNSVLVKWEPPADRNGVIQKYIVRYWKLNAENTTQAEDPRVVEVSADETAFLVDGLSASTRYGVDVSAVTRVGNGPRVEANFESGVTPELPGRPTALNASNITARGARLQFSPGFDGHSPIRRWIVEARVGDDTIFLPVFNVSQPKATTIFVDGLRPYTKYQLRLVAENIRGRSAASEPTRPFHTSATFPDTPPDNVFVEPIGAVSARVTWTPLLAGQWNGPPIGYVLMSRRLGARLAENKTNETNWTEILISNPRSGEAVLSTLKPFTLYEVKVCAKNSFGCSQFTDPISTFTYESVPSASPNEIVARAERNSIKVSWRPVDELERNGNILGYLVSVSEVLLNGTNVFEKELEVNGEQNCSVEIEGLMSAVVYRVTVVAFTVIGDGPPGVANRTVTTAENVPDKPSSVSFLYRFINEVRLTWRPPTRPNGRILGYSIRYWLVDGVESDAVITQVPANVEIFSATSLTPNVAYEFAIRAETAVGWGAERHVRVWTTEQSVPLPTPAPPSRNLVRPQLPDAIHLTWSVQADDGGVHFYKRAGQMRKMTRRMNDDDATRSALAEIRLAEVEYRRAENNAEGAERRAHNGSFWTNAMILDLDIFPDADSNDQQQQHRTVTVKGLYPNTAYKFRLRFVGDFAKSIWSYESEWIRTSEAPPGAAPQLIETIPQGSRSLLVKWRGTPRDTWNADIVGYRLLYRIYEPANASDAGAPFDTLDVTAGELLVEAMRARRDKRRVNETNVFQKLLKNLISFRHYIVHVEAVNAMGTSRRARSTPAFAYVGYTLPTVRVDVVEARALSSTSIRVAWTHEKLAGNDETLSDREEGAINGYRIRYAPSRQTIAGHNNNDADDENFGGLLETDVVTTDQCCEFTLTDLRKFTNYTIHIAAYNRAGEGLRSEIEAQTNEDVPGPVGSLVFEDVLLDSVNVSWTPPQRANGRIVGYVVSYRTYRLDAESRREIQQRTELSYWWANDLDENATYFFSVAAETMAGRGIETTANVNIGFNEGAPSPAGRPHISLEHSTFLLRWDAPVSQGAFPIKGHLIQAKQLAMNSLNRVRETRNSGPNRTTLMFGARDQQSENGNSRRLTRRLIAERHPLGEWFTLANVDDDANGGGSGGGEFRVAYRQLEPSARYVFRVFARNRVGVGRPSADSEPLFVPASLPDDPFWNQWWFLVIVALVLLLVVLVFVSLLLWTGRDIRRAAYGAVFGAGGGENAKKDAFDTLQLSDGVAYELHHSSRGAKRGEDLLRPNTHTSWISTMGAENNGAADGATTNAAICASSFSRRVSAISDYQHVAGNNYNLLDKSRTTMESNATSKYESDETYHRTSRANNNNGAAGKIDAVNGCHSFYDALTTDAIPSEFVGGAPSATSAKKKNAAAAATVDEGHYFDAGQPYGLYDHDEATMGVDDPFMGGYSATSINNSNQYDAFIGGYRRVSDHFDKHSDNAGNTTNSFLLEQLPTSARQIASNDGTDGIKGLGPAVGSGGFSSFV